MAKIVQKGLWISIKSLDKESKKNYLTSMTLFFIGALAWGIHCLLYTSDAADEL